MWLILPFAVLLLLMLPLEEADVTVVYNQREIPRDEDDVEKWWDKFVVERNYPFYGIVISSETDNTFLSLLPRIRNQFSQIAGEDCLFIYFLDTESARDLSFNYQKHARWVSALTNAIELDYHDAPYILFLREMFSGDYVYLSLKDRTPDEIIALVRESFTHVRQYQDSERFNALLDWDRGHRLRGAGTKLLVNLKSFAPSVLPVLIALLKAMAGSGR